MQPDITADQLRRHVQHLAGTIGERNVYRPQALHAAEDYIRETWRGQGYDVVPQEYTVVGVRSANLEITRRGTVHPAEIILVGAHYDSVPGSPGANDNASGIAALLELSRLFAHATPARTLRFVAFVNEEPPFFLFGNMGSMHYARAARQRGDDIRLMISLETIGFYSDASGSQSYPPLFRYFFPHRANFIGFVSNFRSRRALRRFVGAYRAVSDFPVQHVATFAVVPGVAWSDHLSFWRNRYRALMVTDTAFYRYPWYHTGQDTPDKLNYGEFARMTSGLFQALVALADVAL
jgi:Zn-dependent M28 family amino/carboxypeptidase